jgi:nucleotide-binding universal stress UspA family protein
MPLAAIERDDAVDVIVPLDEVADLPVARPRAPWRTAIPTNRTAGLPGWHRASPSIRSQHDLRQVAWPPAHRSSPMTTGPVIVGVGGASGADDALALGQLMAAAADATVVPVTASAGTDPAEVLHDAAIARNAAMIVVGSPHRGMLGRARPGSVARRLLTSAACPVAVAPRGYANRRDPRLQRIGAAYEPTREGQAALATAHHMAARTGAELVAIGCGRCTTWRSPGRPPTT